MAKIRVYELARELDKDNKSLEEVIRGLGIQIKNYMSTLTPDEAERVRASMGASSKPAPAAAAPVRAKTVIRRRAPEVRRRRAEREEEEAEEAEDASRQAPPASPASPSHVGRPAPASSPLGRPAVRAPGVPSARPQMSPSAGGLASSPRGEEPRRHLATDSTGRPADSSRKAQSPQARPPMPAGDSEGPEGPADDDDEGAPRVKPQVGTRIELPKGTRRLPGGMASRLESPPPSHYPEVREGVSPGSAGSAPSTRPQEARGPRGIPVTPAPTSTSGIASASPEASTEPAAAGEPQLGRRVVRNEAGVIVGATSARSEPKILGFIALQPSRKRQQVIITDASEDDKRGRASQRKQREERAQAQGRRRKMTRKGGKGGMAGPSRVSTVEMSDEKKRIRVDEAIQVSDLAHQMGQKASVVLRALWGMGLRGLTINHAIDYETAELVGGEFGYTVENVSFQENEYLLPAEGTEGDLRAPVVTMMGHVDHGKTSLLDHIRATRVAAGEAGGITQHIGAYKVGTPRGDVVFLDTPGHEAFTAMRSRGAQITDIVVLVIAADDGVMPTTVEAIKHAREAQTPLVVAINKVDKPEANPGRVKQALMEQSVVGEEFGGNTPILEVSAKSGQGVDELLETLAVQAEVLELTAPVKGRAKGVVLEARIDKGRGTIVTVLVQSGTLKAGDILVANEFHGKVRLLFDAGGKKIKEAGPSTPAEVLGLSGVPDAGDAVNVVESERDAKALVSHRRELRRRKESVRSGPSIHEMLKRRKTAALKVVLKSDVQGSAQALAQALEELSTEKVKVEVIKSEVGQINETDVKYARAGDAVIFGFNVKTTGKAAPVADAEGVSIRTFSVIYEATELAKELMLGLVEPEYREREQGEAEVRALFPIPRLGVVAGCRVLKGLIQRTSHIRVVRDGEVLHHGTIASLRVHKDDVREVKDGFECGIVVDGFPAIQEGDKIQAYEVEAIPPTL